MYFLSLTIAFSFKLMIAYVYFPSQQTIILVTPATVLPSTQRTLEHFISKLTTASLASGWCGNWCSITVISSKMKMRTRTPPYIWLASRDTQTWCAYSWRLGQMWRLGTPLCGHPWTVPLQRVMFSVSMSCWTMTHPLTQLTRWVDGDIELIITSWFDLWLRCI